MSEAIKCPTSRFLDEARSQVAGIYSATGLTPKKILEQRNELLEALQWLVRNNEDPMDEATTKWGFDRAKKTIAKTLGEQA